MLCHGIFDILMIQVGSQLGAAWVYWVALILVVYWQWQQYLRVENRDRQECHAAFLDNNHIGWLWLAAIAAHFAFY